MLEQMMEHAAAAYPQEACGLVVATRNGTRARLIRAKNIAADPIRTFDLDPDAWLEVGDTEEVIGVYHSHPDSTSEPSMADRTSCEASGLPWHIVGYPLGSYSRIEPVGFRAPYKGRPYVHAIHDCYGIMRDWYSWEWGLHLPDFKREDLWWEKGQNLYLDNFEACGFVQLIDKDPQQGDMFLIQANGKVPNHAAIWLSDGTILHHVRDRLSGYDPWGGFWLKHSTHHLRHNSKIGSN